MRCILMFCLSFGDRYYPFLPPCPWLVGISLELGFGRAIRRDNFFLGLISTRVFTLEETGFHEDQLIN